MSLIKSAYDQPNLTSDHAALELLISLRDNFEVQNDKDLFKMLNDAVLFMTTSSPDNSLTTHQISDTTELKAPSLVPFLQIDTSREDSENGLPGSNGSYGGIGHKGTEGSYGKSAGDINLQLMIRNEFVDIRWESGSASMLLGNPTTSIFLRACGGIGGNGGSGGKGGLGIPGGRGIDATRYAKGTDGERGRPGGTGGDGGNGGNGGNGGHIKVTVSPENSDLLMLLNNPEVGGGLKGRGGTQGHGGVGGKGGPGGSSHSWLQEKIGTRTMSNGQGGTSTQVYSYYVPCTNPGGSEGPQGNIGESGKIGTYGKQGMDGSFRMIVGNIAYQTLYDLAITVSKIVNLSKGNPDDIYEPGEHVNLKVSVHNTGGMPTPTQDIDISYQPGQWIKQENDSLTLLASQSLAINGSHAFSKPFSFFINDQYPSTEESLNKQETLNYQALLRRVNKSFSNVGLQKDLFSVRYPVEISPLKGKVVSSFDEKFTFSLFIQNISSIPMGKTGPQKRRVFVLFEISKLDAKESSDKNLFSDSEKNDLVMPNKITVEVDHLLPKSEEKLEVSFSSNNLALYTQSKVQVTASLYLDYFSTEKCNTLGQTRCIQKRTFQM